MADGSIGRNASLAGARTVHLILEQLPRLDRERLCDPGDIVDRHVALGTFDRTA
jgi:hypothetical protein